MTTLNIENLRNEITKTRESIITDYKAIDKLRLERNKALLNFDKKATQMQRFKYEQVYLNVDFLQHFKPEDYDTLSSYYYRRQTYGASYDSLIRNYYDVNNGYVVNLLKHYDLWLDHNDPYCYAYKTLNENKPSRKINKHKFNSDPENPFKMVEMTDFYSVDRPDEFIYEIYTIRYKKGRKPAYLKY